jgi:hypothetical protein
MVWLPGYLVTWLPDPVTLQLDTRRAQCLISWMLRDLPARRLWFQRESLTVIAVRS